MAPEHLPAQGDRSFSKSKRLLKKLEFKKVLDAGYKVVCPEMVVFALSGEHNARLGLIVSKKVGKSTKRNLVKRRLREIFRSYPHENCWDLVIIARPKAAETDYHQLAAAFSQCYSRLQKKWERNSAQSM